MMINETFVAEAMELLDDLESSLLMLEQAKDDKELVNRIFRDLHTIKGSGKMFGCEDAADFTHDIETTYDLVRVGEIKVSTELISLTLDASDILRKMINREPVDQAECDRLLDLFKVIYGNTAKDEPPKDHPDESAIHPKKGRKSVFRIRFKPHRNIFQFGANLSLLFDELRGMGDCSLICHHADLPDIHSLEAESCYLSWDIVMTTAKTRDEIRDVFIFVEEDCDLTIEAVTDEVIAANDSETHPKIGEILVSKRDMSQEQLIEALNQKTFLGEQLVKANIVSKSCIDAALEEQKQARKLWTEQQESALVSTVRVSADKLDSLVDLVGEIVIVQARLSQHASALDAVSVSIAEEVERLTSELRDKTMSLRMQPVGNLFSKFKRLVRDLSNSLKKPIDLVLEGGETELDKTVIEQLNNPLVHIIRNSADHGIESPEARASIKKKETGTIRLRARQSGSNVTISVSDDGAGLDTKIIHAKAVQKGIIEKDASLTEKEVWALIFEPGFSTSDVVSDLSGRGVGMDVVKKSIEALRGSVDVTSVPNQGTTITITLPLTMAIIDGLLVETADEKYVIPQTAVIECFEQTREDREKAHFNHVIRVMDKMIPYICLRERFSLDGDIPETRRIILCEAGENHIGFAVDRVIGNYQTVIKPLGDVYKHIQSISGATILGDGTVALILDPVRCYNEERDRLVKRN